MHALEISVAASSIDALSGSTGAMSLRPFLRLRRIGSRPPAWACALHTDEFEASRRPPAPAARPAPFPLLLAQSAAVAGRPPAFASDAFLRHRARRRFSSSPKPAEDVEPPAYHGAAPASSAAAAPAPRQSQESCQVRKPPLAARPWGLEMSNPV